MRLAPGPRPVHTLMFDPACNYVPLHTSRSRDKVEREPVTLGLPFPRGWCRNLDELTLYTGDGERLFSQTRTLETWSDGSLRWALIDFIAGGAPDRRYELRRGTAPSLAGPGRLRVHRTDAGVQIETGSATFEVRPDGELRVLGPGSAASRFSLTGANGAPLALVARGDAVIDVAGPVRASVVAEVLVKPAGLHLQCRYEFFDNLRSVRVSARLRNPCAAVHPGGFWDLGDPHSSSLREFAFIVSTEGALAKVACSADAGSSPQHLPLPFDLYQESSGGEHWASSNHVNRHGIVPLTFRGYRMRSSDIEVGGERATPLIEALDRAGETMLTIGMQQFWERFPKAIAVDADNVTLGLLPQQFPDVHEIQPGEQVTERFVVSFGSDASPQWVREPAMVRAEPEWYCAAEAMPHLTPASDDADPTYQSYVNRALDTVRGFAAKREWIDEFGWRNFGDLYADHEAVFHQQVAPLVSHYNNQYDAVAGFAVQFFRTGDERWRSLMVDLARHVIDIDVYHTAGDKSAYNGGMFWHTNHHVDAGTATHRTYPRSAGGSGGPSAEHNYSTGLLLHYFMSGDDAAREVAIQLADWVIAMDDGRRTPLRWISKARTGLASATGSMDYHGPGRGPGNSIVVLLNAWRLSRDARYLTKAEELIVRCAHPEQDLDALNLLDAERRWYYTVFLQALSRYLDCKAESGSFDAKYAFACQTILHYARWMERHERPYLDTPERLEFPNETWVAQDMRKAEVFDAAARYTGHADERVRFRSRAQFFHEYVMTTLPAMPTSTFTRPLVLLLTNGHARSSVLERQVRDPALEKGGFPVQAPFSTQRQVAFSRALIIVSGAVVSLLLALLALLA